MLDKFVLSPRGLKLDRNLVRWTGHSLTIPVFARATGFKPGPALYLETTGRKSGVTRGVALPYFEYDDKIMIVGSNGGGPQDTHWVLNLRTTPEAVVYIKRKRRPVRARFSEGKERDRYWKLLKDRVPAYRQYEQRTTREIPVVILESR
jgi:deazaflavin-dependent oxidoreductase (nitroreductase family)